MVQAHEKSKKLIDAIEPPMKLTDQQVKLAKQYAYERLKEGFTIASFCSNNNLSSKTFYVWKEQSEFMEYLNRVQDALLPEDAVQAYENVKKKVIEMANKGGATNLKEIKLFQETFPSVVESDRRKQLEELGLDQNGKAKQGNITKSPEEHKESLLRRLKKDDRK
ncbi:phBC6A51 family helix-turn-helix protein [Salimicrobium sp. PL1-032A]|uniref:phBC6A51 family helix-turn-helix protein n=1 Tax=Salimicrobium sp. PL1-032A TaxID=3095364 RepID=UPI003260E428